MNRCKCGAISHTTHPFGKRSKSRTYVEKDHQKACRHYKEFL